MARPEQESNRAISSDYVRRLRELDTGVTKDVFERYFRKLARIADRHLNKGLSARLDGNDVAQSVFRTFFRRVSIGEFEFAFQDDLWRLLVKITVLKARARARFHSAQNRSVTREENWKVQGALNWVSMLQADPRPEEVITLIDEVESLVKGLPDTYREILHLRLASHTVAEVANKLDVSRQTVYRALDLFKQRLLEKSAQCDEK